MTVDGTFRLDGSMRLVCEVLVIGSGAGGSVAAHELLAAGRDVLLVEEGRHTSTRTAAPSAAEGVASLWRNGGLTVAMGSPPVAYAEGCCLGGGTEINSAIVQRVPEFLLDQWARDYAIADFGADQLKPFYEKVYRVLNASRTVGNLGEPSEILKTAAIVKGWAFAELERAQVACVGTNMCASGCPTGAKQSMTTTVLAAALRRGLRVVTGCRIHHLARKGRRVVGARGVATDVQGRRHRVYIEAEHVIVAGGAIHSPALLRASGFTHAVGNSLRLHPTVKVLAEFPFQVAASAHRLPLYAVTQFMPDIRIGGSVFVPGFFGMALAEDWSRRASMLEKMDHCAIYYAMVRAQGRGTIRPLPGNRVDPLVRFELAHQDLENLRSGLLSLAELMFSAGARRLFPSMAQHGQWNSLDEVRQALSSVEVMRSANLMTIHLFGSCPMGEEPHQCATDSFGRVHGSDNLSIFDASLIPEAPGVNPQATVMAIAYRNAAAWLARSRR